MKFTIDPNVPLPIARSCLVVDLTDTMKALKPNDSFLVLFNKIRPKGSVRSAFQHVKKKLKPLRFISAVEKSSTPGATGLRIWRIHPPSPTPPPTTPA
jgi:hypothetical protein